MKNLTSVISSFEKKEKKELNGRGKVSDFVTQTEDFPFFLAFG